MFKKINEFWGDLWDDHCGFVISVGIVAFVVLFSWCMYNFSSKRSARMINEKYGTSYTGADVFWAGDTIEKMLIGTKHNVNLNKGVKE